MGNVVIWFYLCLSLARRWGVRITWRYIYILRLHFPVDIVLVALERSAHRSWTVLGSSMLHDTR
jgi:hypothetical protein